MSSFLRSFMVVSLCTGTTLAQDVHIGIVLDSEMELVKAKDRIPVRPGDTLCGQYFVVRPREQSGQDIHVLFLAEVPRQHEGKTLFYPGWSPQDKIKTTVDVKKRVPTMRLKVQDGETWTHIRLSQQELQQSRCLPKP